MIGTKVIMESCNLHGIITEIWNDDKQIRYTVRLEDDTVSICSENDFVALL